MGKEFASQPITFVPFFLPKASTVAFAFDLMTGNG